MPGDARAVRVRAFAKINLALRVVGVRADGYHELLTTFQSLALHDTLTFTVARGPFHIACDDPACPADRTNLVWRAADEIWRAAGRRGEPGGVRVRIEKRIPLAAGLGGGSSDAAASLRALASLWGVELGEDRLRRIAAGLGADVPYFLQGGTALGVERGDVLFPLIDWPASWVVLLLPNFGVNTVEAYRWHFGQ
jgi:4-diphosphocytidyl-2-C-methyl-D-erythritol kinase